MGGQHQVRFARMHNDVADRYVRKIMAFVLSPMLSAVQRDPKAEFRAQVKNVLGNGIFLDDMRVAAYAAIRRNDGRPGLPIVRRFENMRLQVSKRVAVEGRISRSSIIEPRLNPGDP